MAVKRFQIEGLLLIETKIFEDDRGFFFESFHKQKLLEYGLNIDIVQQNCSGSKKNVLRGLHYQIKYSQGKFVRVIKGEVFDVAVDLRKYSFTFGKWEGVILSDTRRESFWIPPGFAHGFCVLSDWAEVEYSTTEYYYPEYDRTIIWNDPDLKIKWPIKTAENIIISEKDSLGKFFREADFYE